MNETPPARFSCFDLEHTHEGSALCYWATMLKQYWRFYPRAALKMTGNSTTIDKSLDRLSRALGVPTDRIIVVRDWNNRDGSVVLVIVFNPSLVKRIVEVEFKLDFDALPITVEFEVAPDGAYVEEVKLQLNLLKSKIKAYAASGQVRNIKIGTKVEGLAMFDRPTSDKVETALKAKIKAVLSADLRVPGTQRSISVEFSGAAGAKFADHRAKPLFEGGVTITVPLDF
jgi:hypothetical protein